MHWILGGHAPCKVGACYLLFTKAAQHWVATAQLCFLWVAADCGHVTVHLATTSCPFHMHISCSCGEKVGVPSCRSLTELTADVKETSEAIEAVSNDDAALAAICLSERPSAGSELMPSILK